MCADLQGGEGPGCVSRSRWSLRLFMPGEASPHPRRGLPSPLAHPPPFSGYTSGWRGLDSPRAAVRSEPAPAGAKPTTRTVTPGTQPQWAGAPASLCVQHLAQSPPCTADPVLGRQPATLCAGGHFLPSRTPGGCAFSLRSPPHPLAVASQGPGPRPGVQAGCARGRWWDTHVSISCSMWVLTTTPSPRAGGRGLRLEVTGCFGPKNPCDVATLFPLQALFPAMRNGAGSSGFGVPSRAGGAEAKKHSVGQACK